MQTISLIRTILLSSFALTLISVIAGLTLIDTLPTILQSYLSQEGTSDIESDFYMFFVVGLFALMIASIVGVWQFKNWGRILYVVILMILFALYPTLDPIVMNGWEAMFSDLSFMLEGALILMMFTGEISKKFTVQVSS